MPSKMVVLIFVIMMFLFGLLILHERNNAQKYKVADFTTYIPETFVTGKLGGLRGGLYYNDSCAISTSAKLIENKQGFKNWKSNDPYISFPGRTSDHLLNDLSFPYTISKEANSDTLLVQKNGYVLKFLLWHDY